MPSRVISILQRRSLPQIIAVAGMLLVAAVIGTFGWAAYWLHERTLRDEERRLDQLALVVAEQTDRAFAAIDSVLLTVAAQAARSSFDDPDVRATLQRYLAAQAEHLTQVNSFLVLDRNGDLIIDSSSVVPRSHNGADRENFVFFQSDPEAEFHITAPVISRLRDRWIFMAARALRKADGTFDGIVLSSVDITYFRDFFASIRLGEQSSVSLVRSDAVHLVRHPLDERAIGRSFSHGPIYSDYLQRQDAGVVEVDSPVSGDRRLIAYRASKAFPVVLFITQSMNNVLRYWRTEAMALALFGCAAILVLAIAGAILIRLARRQNELLAEAQAARGAAELASKAAERASRAKSDFLAGVSHDLRTPLNAINGFSEILLGGLAGSLTEKMREYVGFIHTSGQHLLSLLNNLLDLAKIEANRMTILDDDFAVATVVNECLRLVSAQADAGRVTLGAYNDSKLGLRADPVRLRQVLFNLLSNAIKFTPPGGRVEVGDILLEDGALRLSVRDTGIGMSAAEVPMALEPFGQVGNPHTRAREGTGLGLPLVKALVELHGGRLDIESAPGRGTAVHITLPASRVLLKAATRAA